MSETWTCKYCHQRQITSNSNQLRLKNRLSIGDTNIGTLGFGIEAKRCLNLHCAGVDLVFEVSEVFFKGNGIDVAMYHPLHIWRLMPESEASPQPDYIPTQLVVDYNEACLIKDKSPKASATLARRCLQGMIRDFCNIRLNTLDLEIKALRKAIEENKSPRGVSEESVDAIDHVRSVGNIGAHMERDINIIVDVDPDEAQLLIDLIEMLFREWYVERHMRAERLGKIALLSEQKELARKGRDPQLAPPSEKQQSEQP